MYQDPYELRRQYIDQVRKEFFTEPQAASKERRDTQQAEGAEDLPRSYAKVRFFLALFLFLSFLFFARADLSIGNLKAGDLCDRIQADSRISEVLGKMDLEKKLVTFLGEE